MFYSLAEETLDLSLNPLDARVKLVCTQPRKRLTAISICTCRALSRGETSKRSSHIQRVSQHPPEAQYYFIDF